MGQVQQSPVAPAAVEARAFWVPAALARDKMRATKDVLLSVVRDGVPIRLIGADGSHTEVAPDDLPRVMMDGEQSRAWLMQPSGGTTAITPSVGPDPEWGQPFVVHLGKLSAHLEELAKLYDPPAAKRAAKGGRPTHAAKVAALKAAILFLYQDGFPTTRSMLVKHMQQETSRLGFDEPDQSTLDDWAKEFCSFWRHVLDGQGE